MADEYRFLLIIEGIPEQFFAVMSDAEVFMAEEHPTRNAIVVDTTRQSESGGDLEVARYVNGSWTYTS